jgi:hypothetical protein
MGGLFWGQFALEERLQYGDEWKAAPSAYSAAIAHI